MGGIKCEEVTIHQIWGKDMRGICKGKDDEMNMSK